MFAVDAHAMTTLEERIARHVRSAGYRAWREKVEAAGGCLHPVRLTGAWEVRDTTTGQVLARRSGHVFAPCGTRRAAVCPACSDRYAGDAFHLVRAGLAGGEKGVPVTVREKPRVFVTLTAPSFGPVHTRRVSARGLVMPCGCGGYHTPADPRLGTPIDPDTYDYPGAVIWQAHAGELWNRFTITLRRTLARLAGITVREFRSCARLSYAKVAEYQRRGMIHFHAVIRVDGPNGPDDPTPRWATSQLLEDAIRAAVAATSLGAVHPERGAIELMWGEQVDIRHIRATTAGAVEDDRGEISEERLAGYVAKYATKSTGATETGDRPIRSQRHIDHLAVSDHHRRMIQTCWDLGGQPEYADLKLRHWAHMLGFRGHFLTKSRAYSTTFKAIRQDRADYRAAQALAELGVTAETVTVINHWAMTAIGYDDEAERELAHAIAERRRELRRQKYEREVAA